MTSSVRGEFIGHHEHVARYRDPRLTEALRGDQQYMSASVFSLWFVSLHAVSHISVICKQKTGQVHINGQAPQLVACKSVTMWGA
jgi:hypothetical protein